MISKYVQDPSAEDFLEWAKTDKNAFEEFYANEILPLILDLEQDDYFGTEGFDKRFSR